MPSQQESPALAGSHQKLNTSRNLLPIHRQLEGQCVTPEGAPVNLAIIIGFGVTKEGIWEWQTELDADGRFVISPPESQDCDIICYAEGFTPTRISISASRTDLGSIRMTEGKRAQGVVLDREGTPISGAIVAFRSRDRGSKRLFDFGRDMAVKTSSDGTFISPLLSGQYTLLVPQRYAVSFPTPQNLMSAAPALSIHG